MVNRMVEEVEPEPRQTGRPGHEAEAASAVAGNEMSNPTVHRRPSRAGKREIRRLLANQNAAEAVKNLTAGCEIYGFTKGQFSLINLIEQVLDQAGPAHVTVATWTAASGEIEQAYRLLTDGRILSMRFIVDFSFRSRKPDYCAALRHRFGDDCIRVTKFHAKFVLIRNERWNLVIRTSMNLNENPRFESFDISDDLALAEFVEGVVADIWQTATDAEALGERPYWYVERFHEFGIDPNAQVDDGRQFGANMDDPAAPGVSILKGKP